MEVSSLNLRDLVRSFEVINRLVDSLLTLRSKVNLILTLYVPSTFSSLFLISALIVSINHNNYTNKCIAESGRFTVSILSEQSDPSIIGTFGFQSGRDVNKFDAVPFEIRENMPVVQDACAFLCCEVINKMETDTHTVFLGRVLDADLLSGQEPMTYAYYHKVVKGKSPKNAPTFPKRTAPQHPHGCAASADMYMMAKRLLKNCLMTMPARCADSRNPYL